MQHTAGGVFVMQEPDHGWTDPLLSPLGRAIEDHYVRFGSGPNTWGLTGIGRDDDLAAAIREAIRESAPLDAEALARAWGRTTPPGAVA